MKKIIKYYIRHLILIFLVITLFIASSKSGFSAVTVTLSSNNPAVASANVCKGAIKAPIYRFVLTRLGGGGDPSFTAFSFTTNAGYVAADISKFQMWTSTTDDINTATQLSTNITTSLGPGAHPFAAFSISLTGTHYFWITADISGVATSTNTITVATIDWTNITCSIETGVPSTFIGGTQTIPTITAPSASNDGPKCGTNSFQITASGGTYTNYYWYDAASGGNYLGTGAVYNTPSISSTTSYYVSDANLSSETSLSSGVTGASAYAANSAIAFDLTNNSASPILVTQISERINVGSTSVPFQVYYRNGTFSGFTASSSGWTQVFNGSVTTAVLGTPTVVNVTDFIIPAGATYGIYFYCEHQCVILNPSSASATDGIITIAGSTPCAANGGMASPFASALVSSRTFQGAVYYKYAFCESSRTQNDAVVQCTPVLTIGSNTVSASNVCAGTVKAPIQSFSLAITSADGNLTNVGFTTTGTYVQADIDKYQLWYNSTNNISTASQLGVDLASSGGAGARSFAAFTSPILTNGNTYYFWITADIAAGAINNNTIAVNAISTGNLTSTSSLAGGPSSAGGTKTFTSPSTISVHPIDDTVCQNDNTSFSVTASGGTTDYQWQVSTDAGSTWNNISAAGSSPTYSNWTTATLNLTGTDNPSGYKYRCLVGCSLLASNAATLTVIPPSDPSPTGASSCTSPASMVLSAGGAIVGEVYKWYDAITGGTLLKTSADNTDNTYTTPSIGTTTVYYITIYRTAGGCESYPRVPVTATIVTAPTTQASDIVFPDVQFYQMDVNWTSGNGSSRVVIMNTTNSFTNPTDGTDPAANSVYAGSGEQVIYNGSGSSVTVTGLSVGTTYWFRVYEKNCTGATTKYYTVTATDNPNSQITASLPLMTTIFVSDFEACDATWTTDLTSGTSISASDATTPYSGSRHGSVIGGCGGGTAGCYDGSFITPLLTFYPECSYNIKVYARATTCAFSNSLKVMKSVTATNAAMKAATGGDIILGATSPALSTTYQLYTNSFTVSSEETKYIGIQLYSTGAGGCAGASIYIDKVIITKDCPQCYNTIQDANETTGMNCGGPCFSSAPTGGTVAPASASAACSNSFTLCLSGSSGHIQWQYSLTGGDPWTDISEQNNTTLSGTVTQTTYFRAKVTKDGCTPTPAYSNTATMTVTAFGSKTWLTTGTTAWGTGTNWSPSGVPTYCDDVTIPSGGTQPTISGAITAECRNLTVNGTLTITGGPTTIFNIYGDVTNSGTITHNSNAFLTINLWGGSNVLGGAGTWNGTLGPMINYRAGANYLLTNNIYSYYTTINSSASLTLQSYTYVADVASGFIQDGTVNINSGVLEIRGSGASYTNSLLNHDNGTYYTNYGAASVGLNFNDDDFNNVKRQCDPGYTLTMQINVNVGNDFTVAGGTFAGSTYTLTVGENNELFNGATGNFINNSTFTANTGTVVMKGAYTQNIQGTNPTTFYNLTIDNSGNGVVQVQPVTVSNTFALTKGAFKLNSQTATVTRAATAAITRTNGYVVSELNSGDNTSKLQWNIGATTGAHEFPFGSTAGDYIPVTFNNSGDVGNITISTRRTSTSDNTPWAAASNVSAVSSMSGLGTDETSAIDRWWDITSSLASPIPAVTLSLTYLGEENTMTNPADRTGELGVQHWNGSVWDDGKGGGSATVSLSGSSGSEAAGPHTITVTNQTYFSPRVIVKGSMPLPVELISFTSYCNKYNELNWATATEVNNNYFVLEKSYDGNNFSFVAKINASGNSNDVRKYSYTDYSSNFSLVYYRLKQVDYNGDYTYSDVISTYCKTANELLDIFKANSDDLSFLIKNAVPEKNYMLIIYDQVGKCLVTKNIQLQSSEQTVSFDENLSSGIYNVVVRSEDDFICKQFVIYNK